MCLCFGLFVVLRSGPAAFASLRAESEDPRYGYNVGCNLVYQFPTSQFADAKYYGDPTWHHGLWGAAKFFKRQVNYQIRVSSLIPTAMEGAFRLSYPKIPKTKDPFQLWAV